MKIALFLAIGLTVGSVSGALGIGGGVLLIPALVWICGFDQRMAAGTSLAALVPPIGLPAAWKYYNQEPRAVDLEAAVCIAVAFAAGAYLGASVVHLIPTLVLRLFLGLLMIFIAVRFIVASDSDATAAGAGLAAVTLAWLSFLGLRLLGRRHRPRPSLAEQIQTRQRGDQEASDYHI